jgi:hypothetical protein
MDSQSQSISNQQPLTKCGKYFLQFLLSLLPEPSRSDAQVMIQQTSGNDLKNLKRKSFNLMATLLRLAHVDRAAAALKNLISTREVNARLLVGLALVGIITPLADIFYTWLPAGRVPESEWYYESWYWLFLCLGPYIQVFTGFLGAYLILFQRWNINALFLVAPMWLAVVKIVWLAFFVEAHAEFLSVPPLAIYLYCAAFMAVSFGISNYLAWRKYHRADAHEARMNGLCQIANMSDPIQAGFVKTWNEMKAKNY